MAKANLYLGVWQEQNSLNTVENVTKTLMKDGYGGLMIYDIDDPSAAGDSYTFLNGIAGVEGNGSLKKESSDKI